MNIGDRPGQVPQLRIVILSDDMFEKDSLILAKANRLFSVPAVLKLAACTDEKVQSSIRNSGRYSHHCSMDENLQS